MKLTCSVVAGADPTAITAFLDSLHLSVEWARMSRPGLEFESFAIINSTASGPVDVEDVRSRAGTVIVNRRPRGFAANHNMVMSTLSSDMHLIANDDVLVPPGTIGCLLDIMGRTQNADVGALSPRLVNTDGSLQPSTYSFPTVPSVALDWLGLRDRIPRWCLKTIARVIRRSDGSSRLWNHDREVSVDTFRGAFVLMRTTAIRQVGLMSEVALVGGEEVEWHARLDQSGWRRVFTPEVSVTHHGSKTVGGRSDLEAEYVKGTLNFFAQHGSYPAYAVCRLVAALRLRRLARAHKRATNEVMPRYGDPISAIRFRSTSSRNGPGA